MKIMKRKNMMGYISKWLRTTQGLLSPDSFRGGRKVETPVILGVLWARGSGPSPRTDGSFRRDGWLITVHHTGAGIVLAQGKVLA